MPPEARTLLESRDEPHRRSHASSRLTRSSPQCLCRKDSSRPDKDEQSAREFPDSRELAESPPDARREHAGQSKLVCDRGPFFLSSTHFSLSEIHAPHQELKCQTAVD